jgi:hypothetical protein
MKTWDEVKSEFETDGSLRDIYVWNADVDLWNVFLRKIAHSPYRTEFFHGERRVDLPSQFIEIKALQETDITILHVWTNDKIQLNCHFFLASEIELDASPYDISGEPEYNALVGFLKWLSGELGRKVVLTHEGSPNLKILEIEPTNVYLSV